MPQVRTTAEGKATAFALPGVLALVKENVKAIVDSALIRSHYASTSPHNRDAVYIHIWVYDAESGYCLTWACRLAHRGRRYHRGPSNRLLVHRCERGRYRGVVRS